jgi:HlyD family type I secretion membrane fusion protein
MTAATERRGAKRPNWPVKAPSLPIATRGTAIVGAAMILISVLGLGAWAVMVPIASAIVAQGQVIVASKRKQVQHLTGGIIKSMSVEDGSVVAKGDKLAELEDGDTREQFTKARDMFYLSLATEARLLAEIEDSDALVFPAELIGEAKPDPRVQEVIDGQRRLFQARRRELRGELDILEQKRKQLENELHGLQAERNAAAEQSKLARGELATLDELFKKGYTTRRQILIMKREITQLGGSTGRLSAQMARINSAILEAQLNLTQATTRLSAQLQAELREVQSKIPNLRELHRAARAALDRMIIRAPAGGTVVASKLHTVGAVIRPGDTILEIVPSADRLMLEVQLRPADVDNVKLGLATEVRFSNLKSRTTPNLEGKVILVSADALQDPRTGASYFVAHVDISQTELNKLGSTQLQPGMPAEVMIKTGERTAFSYLMKPLTDSIGRAWREE